MKGRVRGIGGRGMALAAAVLAGLIGGLRAAEGPTASASRPRGGPSLVGQVAPDFDLPLLRGQAEESAQTAPALTDQTVRLSAFRGTSAVVVFMSSYT